MKRDNKFFGENHSVLEFVTDRLYGCLAVQVFYHFKPHISVDSELNDNPKQKRGGKSIAFYVTEQRDSYGEIFDQLLPVDMPKCVAK